MCGCVRVCTCARVCVRSRPCVWLCPSVLSAILFFFFLYVFLCVQILEVLPVEAWPTDHSKGEASACHEGAC